MSKPTYKIVFIFLDCFNSFKVFLYIFCWLHLQFNWEFFVTLAAVTAKTYHKALNQRASGHQTSAERDICSSVSFPEHVFKLAAWQCFCAERVPLLFCLTADLYYYVFKKIHTHPEFPLTHWEKQSSNFLHFYVTFVTICHHLSKHTLPSHLHVVHAHDLSLAILICWFLE